MSLKTCVGFNFVTLSSSYASERHCVCGRTAPLGDLGFMRSPCSDSCVSEVMWCKGQDFGNTMCVFFLKQRLTLHKQRCVCPVASWDPCSSRWQCSIFWQYAGGDLASIFLLLISYLWTFLLSFYFFVNDLSLLFSICFKAELFYVPQLEFLRALQNAIIFLTALAEIKSKIMDRSPCHTWSEGSLPDGAGKWSCLAKQGSAAQVAQIT